MSVSVSCVSNQEDRIRCILMEHSEVIERELPPADGWGLSFYQRGELLKRILPFTEKKKTCIADLIGEVECQFLIGHLREATTGDSGRENIHPFQFKKWSFAHNGTVHFFSSIREQMLENMPPFIRRGIKGNTDSEHIFHLFLSFLHDEGQLERDECSSETVQKALFQTLSTISILASEHGAEQTASSYMLCNGRSLFVLSKGTPTYYTLLEGIQDCEVCRRQTAQPGKDMRQIDHPNLKAVLVVSGIEIDNPAWARIDENSLLSVSSSMALDIRDFV